MAEFIIKAVYTIKKDLGTIIFPKPIKLKYEADNTIIVTIEESLERFFNLKEVDEEILKKVKTLKGLKIKELQFSKKEKDNYTNEWHIYAIYEREYNNEI